MKLVCLMQHQQKCEAKIVMKVQDLKLKCINSMMSGSLSFCGSFMIPVTLCIVMFAERQAQLIPTKWICYRKEKVSTWKSCLLNKSRLIQGINNYLWINTYWSCIVWIGIYINLASNILLLASTKCFLITQG